MSFYTLRTQAQRALPRALTSHISQRGLASAAVAIESSPKKEGDISSAFASLSGTDNAILPSMYADIKSSLATGHEEALTASFHRLLVHLSTAVPRTRSLGSASIPSIDFSALSNPPQSFLDAHRETGVAIIRSVVPPSTTLSWLDHTKKYIASNPSTRGFPAHAPAVYELYWSPAQLLARSHPNMLALSRFLLSLWHTSPFPSSSSSTPLISLSHPTTYADRLRIRPPGDTSFSLGPHVDGGSVERWDPSGYLGLSGPYASIFRGSWESHDPFDASSRLPVTADLHSGGTGACSVFRAYQGWLSLSTTGPGEGTLLVNPLFKAATAYYLLRPFFVPRNPDAGSEEGFLRAENWILETEAHTEQRGRGGVSWSSKLEGAWPGHGQELSAALHPHLELSSTMVSIPQVEPGDYIAWHCDSVHAVDSVHKGQREASSVLYIPACPLTEGNAEYLVRQREMFSKGEPGPDFPGGKGEKGFVEGLGKEVFEEGGDAVEEGKRAMGLGRWDVEEAQTEGGRRMLKRANEILGF